MNWCHFSYSTLKMNTRVHLLPLANTLSHYSYLADTFFIQSNFQLFCQCQGQSPLEQWGFRALLNGPRAALILLWLHWGLNHQSSRCQSSTLACRLSVAISSPYPQEPEMPNCTGSKPTAVEEVNQCLRTRELPSIWVVGLQI